MSTQHTSYSGLTTHNACPQKWFYSNVRKLEKDDPEDARVALDFGNWWHALRAAHSIDRGRVEGSLRWTPEFIKTTDDGPHLSTADEEVNLVEAVYGAARGFWDRLAVSTREVWVEALGESLPERLAYLDEQYREQWAEELLHELPIAVEYKWKRKLPALPQQAGNTDPDTYLVGYIDEIYLDTKRNMVVVRDHKTSKSLDTYSTADDLLDSQLQLYAWGAHEAVQAWGFGRIGAVAYDRARSVKPKTPQLTKAGTLSKSVTGFDHRTYKQWANGPDGEGVAFAGNKKDGSGAGVYEPDLVLLASLDTPAARGKWFKRTLTPLNKNIIKTHLRSAVDTALDMVATRERAELTNQAARNFSKLCSWCDFATLCASEMVGGADGEYDLDVMKLRPKKPRTR